jgi:anti-sigma factor RsiW
VRNATSVTVCDLLQSFADGETGPAESAAFRAHLPECETCRRDLARTMHLIALLSAGRPEQGSGRAVPERPFLRWRESRVAVWRWSWLWFRWEVMP